MFKHDWKYIPFKGISNGYVYILKCLCYNNIRWTLIKHLFVFNKVLTTLSMVILLS